MAGTQTPTEASALSSTPAMQTDASAQMQTDAAKAEISDVSTVDKGIALGTTPVIQTDTAAQVHIDTIKAKADKEEPPLFSADLISPEVASSLPEGYTIRPLRKSDYNGDFLSTLKVLTTVGDISPTAWAARYDFMASRNDTYYILVICDSAARIVGTGGVIVERKFIHNLGMVGHIEDIAVAKNQQGKKLGLRMIEALDFVAKSVGCYKSILDCSEANEGFYVKCGYKRAGLEMAHYFEEARTAYEKS